MRCFQRRWVFSGLAVAALVPPAGRAAARMRRIQDEDRVDAKNRRRITAGGMVFRWQHDATALLGDLAAPTPGWLAVGFNDRAALRGTCFVMAQVSEPPGRMELRRALVPDHEAIADAGVQASLHREEGGYAEGMSRLRFRLSHRSGDALGVILRPGSVSYVMLAWSHARDFAHHSAFREHREVVL